MKTFAALAALALTMCLALPARAEGDRCWLISSVAAASISGGAITTAELTATPGGLRPSAMTPIPTTLKIGVDLVDASDGVTSVKLTFTGAEASGGTFRTIADWSGGQGIPLSRGWDPKTGGKNWDVEGVGPWRHPFFKITATPLGHGAGDTLAFEVYGCTAQAAGDAGSMSLAQIRACAFAPGGWTPVDCSAGVVYSAQLDANARYIIQAVDGSPNFRQDVAGSGLDADGDDATVPVGAWFEMSTVNGSRFFSCLGTAAPISKLTYIKCD